MSRRKPRAHLWLEDGGMVTGTDDPAVARPLLISAYYGGYTDEEVEHDAEYVAGLFPIDAAKVERGRIIPTGPNSYERDEGFVWLWKPLPDTATGRGVITAVVWQHTR